jgi:hypothetical protein
MLDADSSGKGGYIGTYGCGVSLESLVNMGFFDFLLFFPALESCCHPSYHDLTCFL